MSYIIIIFIRCGIQHHGRWKLLPVKREREREKGVDDVAHATRQNVNH